MPYRYSLVIIEDVVYRYIEDRYSEVQQKCYSSSKPAPSGIPSKGLPILITILSFLSAIFQDSPHLSIYFSFKNFYPWKGRAGVM